VVNHHPGRAVWRNLIGAQSRRELHGTQCGAGIFGEDFTQLHPAAIGKEGLVGAAVEATVLMANAAAANARVAVLGKRANIFFL
jgi:hypothetical protein